MRRFASFSRNRLDKRDGHMHHSNTSMITQTTSLTTTFIDAPLRHVRILGVRLDNVTANEAVERIMTMALSGSAHQVMTVNPEFIMIAQRDEIFRAVLEHAALCIADGMGVIWASRFLKRPLAERITGVDTVNNIARQSARRDVKIFLLGAAPGVAEQTARILETRYPGLRIAGWYSGSPRPEEEDEICRRIESVRPHILLVAFGAPKQDIWIQRTRERLQIPVAIGVGGTFDFIAGIAVRAPLWMQSLGLEWFYRLLREPWRWRRMMALPQFVAAVWKSKHDGSRRSSDGR
jgi:N-acetylglucosaminyldiphosphoundecaprenol N-acetyl-beta-D-mannosaminyltransferase